MRLAAAAAGLIALLSSGWLMAQSDRSLTNFESGSSAEGQTQDVPAPDAVETGDDAAALRERIVLLRSSIKALTESLAISNGEAEVFRRQADDLQLKMEALGLPAVEKDESKIEERLLDAVRDLRIMKKQNEDAVNELVRLTEAVEVLIKSTDNIDPKVQMMVETELRKTSEVLGSPAVAKANSLAPTLTDGMVVDVKDDLSLVVGNIGTQQDVRVGTPFQVWRNDKLVGEVRVVDVRDRICGAVIQNLESDKNPIKTGDRLKVDAQQ